MLFMAGESQPDVAALDSGAIPDGRAPEAAHAQRAVDYLRSRQRQRQQ